MNFRVAPEAQEEADEAAAFYESREEGLGLAFVLELQNAYRRVQCDPESWPRVADKFYRARLNRFPYDIVFRVYSDEFLVLAVAHHHRRPGYWRRRDIT